MLRGEGGIMEGQEDRLVISTIFRGFSLWTAKINAPCVSFSYFIFL